MKVYFLLGGMVAVSLVAMTTASQAGFQFTAPVGQVQQEQPVPPLSNVLLPQVPDVQMNNAVMPAAPVGDVQSTPTPLTPEVAPTPAPMAQPVMQQQAASQNITPPAPRAPMATAPQTGIASLAPLNAQPVIHPAPAMQQAAPRPMPTSNGYAMAVGFGKDLPLVTALRQVVPADYTYVLDQSVPVSQTVSWNGGRPWNVVLQDMVEPLGLQSSVSGQRVTIMKAQSAIAPIQSAPVSEMTEVAPVTMPPVEAQQPQEIATYTPAAPVAPVMTPSDVMVQQQPTVQFSAPPTQIKPTSAVVPKVTRGTWIASKGDSLRTVLEEWTVQAGADMFWSSDYDYPLAGEVNISGTFEEAVQTLLQGFDRARPKPIARLHPNLPHGPAVLVVETRQTIE